ncbi:MAG: hypothetical protein LBH58_00575 [Tannerellaceae bacterium]|jgi:sugar lactone lactonase YvrE|nr:hypothetical protein [Tannerellaceae bacterium]
MKRLLFIFICSTFLFQPAFPQSTGTWKSYLSYHNTTLIAEGNNHVFAVANGSLYSYNKDDKSIKYYSKETNPALSDNQITSIRYNTDENILIITYLNGNIDLLSDNGLVNLPFLMENNTIQDKEVNYIYNHNGTAYLAAKFGIIAINLKRKEIKETYRLNTPVSSIAIKDNYIYAATADSIIRASLNENLIDPNNWKLHVAMQQKGDTVKQLAVFQNTLCFLLKGKGIFYQSGTNIQTLLPGNSLTNMKVENEKLLAFSPSQLYIYSSLTNQEKGAISDIKDISSAKNNNIFWLAIGEKGVIGIERTAPNQYKTIVSDIKNEGPKRNFADFVTIHNNKLYVAGGGRWSDRFDRIGTVMIYDTEEKVWNNIEDISRFRDATSIAVDPGNESHFFVSSWGRGVYEFKDNQMIERYHENNSLLQSAASGDSYTRVEGLCYDNKNNLWMTNSGVSNLIKVVKPDGNWVSINIPEVYNVTLGDKILIADNGDKWINLVRADGSGILVYNEKGTLEDTSDDDFYHFGSLNDQGGSIGASEYFCIAKDKNGEIWIGTNRGPVVVTTASDVLINKENTSFNRIIQTNEYGEDVYFLRDERIKAIAVDGGNRKWLGTGNNGLYLVSEDGKKVIEHFTVENSPLLSNTIESIAINNKTGEVFIGTDKGLISYGGDATQGSNSYSNVYAYPNPVRPTFDRKVTITGLMENSNVKITDITGNLIYQTKSTGGQISWDCRNKGGKYVASGVYLVIAATPEAKESVVTKIAVVQ